MSTRIQFDEWMPDQPAVTSLRDAKNVYPTSVGYAPFNNQETLSGAASENLNNIFTGKSGDEVAIFGGGDSKLFKLNGTTLAMDNVSKTGGYASSHAWRFIQFGNAIIAANNTNKLQSFIIGSSTQFADLSADAPIGRYIATVRDFVVATHIDGVDNKIAWSDINDETNWTSGTTSQADYQILPDGGAVKGISGGEFGIIFMEKAIVRMTYSGSPLFFQFDTISSGLGCLEGMSIAQYGATSFFLGDDGFYKCDGQTVTPIGNEKVDRYFFDDINLSEIDTITAAVDPVKKLVVWNYPKVDGGRAMLVYNWQLNKWARVDTLATGVGTIATTGYTLEGLEAVLGYSNIETIPASLDDRLWVGGKFRFAGFRDGYIITFTGNNYNSELVTQDIEVGYNSVATLVRPQIDSGSANIKVASRRELDDNINFGSSVTTSSEGRASIRSAGRYHRFSIIPTGNWTSAIGIDVDFRTQGNR